MRTTPYVLLLLAIACAKIASPQTWISDNGNGTYRTPRIWVKPNTGATDLPYFGIPGTRLRFSK